MLENPEAGPVVNSYVTRGGIHVHRRVESIHVDGAIEPIIDKLDSHRGALLASAYEYPGRYTRWDLGFVDPPFAVVARGRHFELVALNARGRVMLGTFSAMVNRLPAVVRVETRDDRVVGEIQESTRRFAEEDRSRQPSVFSLLRELVDLFQSDADPHLGLYGAFGYNLALQFEPLRLCLPRSADQRDLVLYLPDELIVVDHRRERAERRRYDFVIGGRSTENLRREGAAEPYAESERVAAGCDHKPGEYAQCVREAREAFKRGDLFEVVLSQTFVEPCPIRPSELFRRLRERNPAPYGFLINLGSREYLVGASPEMFVRVEGTRIETCPISGTIARGHDPISDAAQILRLLNSQKDEAELTMCTDVDRNDKSRVAKPGSVRVIGRRQIEMYSRLIHTADHVEGHLRDEFDALDAFLVHTWAVTVTGAPKAWAMQFIEDHEKTARSWYGGAVGLVGFDGNLNTGLTLRTIHVKDAVAHVRVGATLLYDSEPDEEETETRVKASAFLDAIRQPRNPVTSSAVQVAEAGRGKRILLVDHQDSFVHTLANYFRQTGADVVTWRSGFPLEDLGTLDPDLVVLSPGPGRPQDFNVSATIEAAVRRRCPVFGVCLGLQGMVEYFGGELDVLPYPMHGKPSRIQVHGGTIFDGLPRQFTAGRYHSLFAIRDRMPAELSITADSDDGVVMAVEHRDAPLAAVQFHPESILTLDGDVGRRLVQNVVRRLARAARARTTAGVAPAS